MFWIFQVIMLATFVIIINQYQNVIMIMIMIVNIKMMINRPIMFTLLSHQPTAAVTNARVL